MPVGLILLSLASTASGQESTMDGKPAMVIAHRGASGTFPEHTMEAYQRGIDEGADFIEADLVSTKDGMLVARHEPMLSGTTDVADRPEFASRRTTKRLDGKAITDWFASDFTLAEIKTLRARQSFPERDQSMNGRFNVPTLQEIIERVQAQSAHTGRPIGLYIEIKHSLYHSALGLPIEGPLLASLQDAGWTEKTSPLILQSFETANLKTLRRATRVRLVQLIGGDGMDDAGNVIQGATSTPFDWVITGEKRTAADLLNDAGLREIASYADGIGPWKAYLISARRVDRNNDGKSDDVNADGLADARDRISLPPSDLVKRAHAAGLFVHTWTLRNEPHRLYADYDGNPAREYRALYQMGVDGVFSDFPAAAIKAR
jgi:glycerophosphoryl diester phosphodiesterase